MEAFISISAIVFVILVLYLTGKSIYHKLVVIPKCRKELGNALAEEEEALQLITEEDIDKL